MSGSVLFRCVLAALLTLPQTAGAGDAEPAGTGLPGRDTGIVIRRGPEVAPTPSKAVPRIDPVTRALELAEIQSRNPAPRTTLRSTRERFVITPYGWHPYPYKPAPKAGFSLVLKDENFYLRLGDPPAAHKPVPSGGYWFPKGHDAAEAAPRGRLP